MTVQGQSRSNLILSIDSALVISYATSIDFIIVFVTVFEIFHVKF